MEDNDLVTLIAEMERMAGYTYGDLERSVFQPMGEYIKKMSQKYPYFDDSSNRTDFAQKFEKLAYNNVSKGYRSVCVYYDEVVDLENTLDEVIKKYWSAEESGSLNLGNTIRFDTYYHGFLMSYRSTLDYLAGGIAAGYKIQCTSFRKLPKKLNINDELSVKLLGVINKYMPQFHFVVTGESTALRDEIAHYEFIKPHHIIACSSGLRLVGGREGSTVSEVGYKLSTLLLERKQLLINFLDELYSVIVTTEWPYLNNRILGAAGPKKQ